MKGKVSRVHQCCHQPSVLLGGKRGERGGRWLQWIGKKKHCLTEQEPFLYGMAGPKAIFLVGEGRAPHAINKKGRPSDEATIREMRHRKNSLQGGNAGPRKKGGWGKDQNKRQRSFAVRRVGEGANCRVIKGTGINRITFWHLKKVPDSATG